MNTLLLSLSPTDDRYRRHLYLLIGASLAIGLLYVFLVRPGTPYDEPAHFGNVQSYARFDGMPVMGQPGTTYEAYQAPIYYFLSAIVYRASAFAGEEFAFYLLRVLSLLLLAPAILFSFQIARHILPGNPIAALATALFVGINPSLLAIFAGIQNDGLAIVLSMWIMLLTLKWIDDDKHRDGWSLKQAALMGALISLAVLTKLTTLFLIPAIAGYLLVTQRRKALPVVSVLLAVVVALTAWWFARNYNLYGDLTGSSAMKRFFPEGASRPIQLWELGDLMHWLRDIVTYLWLPVQYFRNLVTAPLWLDVGIVGGFLLFSVLGWMTRIGVWRRDAAETKSAAGWSEKILFLSLVHILCFLIYAMISMTKWHLPGRITLPTVALSAFLICQGGIYFFSAFRNNRMQNSNSARLFLALLAAALLAANFYILHHASRIPTQSFHLFT